MGNLNDESLLKEVSDKITSGVIDRLLRVYCRKVYDLLPNMELPEVPYERTGRELIHQISKSYLGNVASSILVPIVCSEDGSCLFNAISIGLYGHEGRSTEIRYRTAIELGRNWRHYARMERATPVSGIVHNVIREAFSPAAYSSYMTMAAASAAINVPIASYFPPTTKK